MFNVDKNEIGPYISNMIDAKYKHGREFCRKWLELTGEEINEDSVRNKANKLSQIKNGLKAIQIYDLPAFSELLDISFEQILSAGKSGAPKSARATNYSIAHSRDASEWEKYINRKDNPILYKDEFGLNALEYAIENGNYDFIRFLMDKGYIWFDSHNSHDYVTTFGAGTSIKKINLENRGNGVFVRSAEMNDLDFMLATEDQLRKHIIAMAADHNDLKMLEALKAREIPELYYKSNYLACDCPDFKSSYDEKMVRHISKSSKDVLDYFTDSFDIVTGNTTKNSIERIHTFVYPFISNLLDMLVTDNNPFLKTAIKKMISYNNQVYEKLMSIVKESCEKNLYNCWKEELCFYKSSNIVSYRDTYTHNGIITNIARISKKSQIEKINNLINELNTSYDNIKNLGGNI